MQACRLARCAYYVLAGELPTVTLAGFWLLTMVVVEELGGDAVAASVADIVTGAVLVLLWFTLRVWLTRAVVGHACSATPRAWAERGGTGQCIALVATSLGQLGFSPIITGSMAGPREATPSPAYHQLHLFASLVSAAAALVSLVVAFGCVFSNQERPVRPQQCRVSSAESAAARIANHLELEPSCAFACM
jgi:hypothetical protein